MKKEQEHTLTAIRECLAKNMPPYGKAILSDYDNVTYPLTELGWDLGKEINPVMYSAKEWQKYKITPFYKNVEKEGVSLWANKR